MCIRDRSYGFDNGLDEDCAKLLAHNSLANLGMYALLDINVNYYGWDEEKTAGILKSFGIADRETARQVFRALAANPVNYLQYYAGCMEFLDKMCIRDSRCISHSWSPA